jgi:DNA-binding response OmpR family regulator
VERRELTGMDSKKILIIDDDTSVVDMLAIIMEAEGYTARKTYSAAEALEALTEKPPDLILLDVMMPEMDGFKFLATIRSNPETQALPVIILSVLCDEQSVLEGWQNKADGYITKPFDPRELNVAVKEVLARSLPDREAVRAQRVDTLMKVIRKPEE